MSEKFEITEELISEFKEMFTLFDKDADGFVSTAYLGTMIRGFG